MAIIYSAVLQPTKTEILASWLPRQPWAAGLVPLNLTSIGAYRFDDPAGDVGIETHLLRADEGTVLQVPVTYRDAPLPGAEPWLIGTMEHSVLGRRWVYDACADPVYAAALASAILLGQREAEQFRDVDGKLEPIEATARVQGSGAPGAAVPVISVAMPETADAATTIRTETLTLCVYRTPGAAGSAAAARTLTGRWDGSDAPAVLASILDD